MGFVKGKVKSADPREIVLGKRCCCCCDTLGTNFRTQPTKNQCNRNVTNTLTLFEKEDGKALKAETLSGSCDNHRYNRKYK
ncbi:hypothetical protein K0M31_019346 [Melipona bicolor]|uniref:Uncharacterized protein n=1 Tax=Melipona bicolor TaxID=60889 RepID=A0AA40KR17_9HYME|nr:hypothetical protein K0M31_019346 [Melipona bicolor]